MSNVNMPRLSDTMEEGTISRWLKKAGDAVQKGDILAEIETDKANMELEAYDAGVLEEILVQEGETVPIGQAIAVIGSGSGTSKASTAQKADGQSQQKMDGQTQQKAQPAQPAQQTQQVANAQATPQAAGTPSEEQPTAESGENGRVKVSPVARRMAAEHGIDLQKVQGKGPYGRIERADIEDFLEQQQATQTKTPSGTSETPATPTTVSPVGSTAAPQQTPVAASQAGTSGDVEVSTLSRVQSLIARRLTESKQSIPHFYVSSEIDMTDVLAMRVALNAGAGEGGVKVSVNDLVVKACALALEKFPEVNSSIKGDQLTKYKRIHVGIAVDVPSGLVVPVIHDANIKGVRTIARESKALIEKARANKLSAADLEGGTFSVSNLGMMDVTDFVAVINPPQAAILAVASTRQQFVPVNGQPVIRDIMPVTMSADHRILYGATVARFLQEVKRLLLNPYSLLG
ncbi:MAG TPA: dihydrolipoamide acetyltransferase family protein [Ktedonobacteraceae bacterium]|nr:dihydrolipoamide acetyltransferase family protein [Ktedonobacteraceae bacterium]